ncbi:MAG: hypothetical protein AAB089_04470 [Nitrospirota bacterium]
MLKLMRSKAQSTAEYAIVIGLVIAAVVAMQVYVKRGLQAKVKGAVDHNEVTSAPGSLGGTILGTTKQFEPDYVVAQEGDTEGMHTVADSEAKTKTDIGGGVTRNDTRTTNKTGVQVVNN